ncbi:MAG: Gfo/Idh/MocA family oxidoreductase [Clostridiales bacterium]|jgi:predicted dehydrogenase|nr:Gfo/Idh/MocA family oxidoreductase [Clostridiales bacterium]
MLGVGLYGDNGHQIQNLLKGHGKARLVAVAGFSSAPPEGARLCASLDEMLGDGEIGLVSLCSPVRAEQAAHAIACLEAGKHVYAEKPCAMSEGDLDAVLAAASRAGLIFREMAGTAFEEPYLSMREIVASGRIGDVVQVLVQKSYPYHSGRPQDEAADGGLLLQVGIHALRLVEHVAGRKIAEISAFETSLGNPAPGGGLRMAANISARLDNGGLASIIANYLNQRGHGEWGNDHLRVFGTKGFAESADGGRRTRLVVGDADCGEIRARQGQGAPSYFDMLVDAILGRGEMPISSEDELSPLRAALRAKLAAATSAPAPA